jgi:hypothetical protein
MAVSDEQTFTASATTDARGRAIVRLPFDPDQVWGRRRAHHIAGTVNGHRVRGPLQRVTDGTALVLGASWRRDCGVAPGDEVVVALRPEGPQRAELAADVAAALAQDPGAAAFFDSLATYYRTGYLRWIDATTRRPDVRAARIGELVDLLKAGVKQRPRGTSE